MLSVASVDAAEVIDESEAQLSIDPRAEEDTAAGIVLLKQDDGLRQQCGKRVLVVGVGEVGRCHSSTIGTRENSAAQVLQIFDMGPAARILEAKHAREHALDGGRLSIESPCAVPVCLVPVCHRRATPIRAGRPPLAPARRRAER
jgi:hypothetical protein